MIRLPIYILIALCLFSCRNPNRDVDLLELAEKYTGYPDSISGIICQIENPAHFTPAQQADYARLFIISRYYSKTPMAADSLIAYPIRYYKTTGDTAKLLETYKVAGISSALHNDYEKSFGYLDAGFQIAKAARDSLKAADFYSLTAQLRIAEQNYAQAIPYLKEAFLYTKSDNADILYSIGLCYARMNRADSSGYFVSRSADMAINKGDSATAAHYLRNYADILYGRRDYVEAVGQLKRSLRYTRPPVYPNFYSSLSLGYLAIGMPDSAARYIDKAKEAYELGIASGDLKFKLTNRNFILLLEALLNDRRHKHVDFYEMGNFNDSIARITISDQMTIDTQQNEREQLEMENLKLKLHDQQIRFGVAISLFAIIALASVVFSYHRKRGRRLVEIEERSESLQILLDNALLNQSDNETSHNFFKKVLLQQLGIIRLIATNPTTQNQELLQQITRISNDDLNVETLLVWDDLYPIIDSVYDGFYTRTKNKYGHLLGEKEMQLCCLLCAGFSTKEISVVTQQSLRTIYQRKTSIRQKLHINEKGDIVEYLKGI